MPDSYDYEERALITYERELRIHALLDSGMPMRAIARDERVPFSTVHAIKCARDISSSLRDSVRADICGLLLSGLSVDAISKKLSVSRESVTAVRRVNCLHVRRVNTPTRCPTCGGAVLPPRGEPYTPAAMPREIDSATASQLFLLADSIVGLSREYIVPNILFYDIARHCEHVISQLGGQNGETETNPAG